MGWLGGVLLGRKSGAATTESPSGPSCRCGHDRISHEHYRRGTDCSAPDCACTRYRRTLKP
ncbi:MAG: hypothetical protein JWM67_3170 [Mycobacterium sp.]|nr:hypothetical protein [Mycobacterium sp.]